MKVRLAGAAVLAGVVAVSQSAHAAPPKLDGKTKKVLTASFTPAAQVHDQDNASIESVDRTQCAGSRCGKLLFTYAPAKGTKGSVGFEVSWGVPAEDIDLFVAAVSKRGAYSEVASCGSFSGTTEKLVVSGLKPGNYALIADFYRSTGGKVDAKVSYPATFAPKTTAPEDVDSLFLINCGL